MKRIVGVVQEQMFRPDALRRLKAGLKAIYRAHDPSERVVVLFMVVPPGYAYSERKPSEATILVIEVDDGTAQSKREAMMADFSRLLLDDFRVSPLDNVITVADTSFVSAFFDAQRNRIDRSQRLRINARLYGAALLSRLREGYLRLPMKLTPEH